MLIYLLLFAVSSLLFYCSEKPEFEKYRRFFVFGALLLPSVVAGFRSENIGVDVKIYAIPVYEMAVDSPNLLSFFKALWLIGSRDVAYNFLNYVLSYFSSDYHLGLFVYQLITIVFVYLGFNNCRKKFGTSIWLCMLVYFFLLYNPSLNIMRQCIAGSILFYGLTCLFLEKYILYFLCQMMAFLFHSSAILGIGIGLMYVFLSQKYNSTLKQQMIKGIVFVGAGFLFVILFPKMLKAAVASGLLHNRYLDYLPGGMWSTIGVDSSINILSVLPSLFYLGLMTASYIRMNNQKKEALFLFFSSLIIFLLDFSPLYANYLTRVGYFFLPFQAVMLANIADVCPKPLKKYYYVLIIAALLMVWIVTVVLLGYYGTVPYEFFWNV